MGWITNLTQCGNLVPRRGAAPADRVHWQLFETILSRALVYNTCWEDPAVDRQALELTPADRMLVITSAGCNVLDYALAGPAAIHAVDANPRQNAGVRPSPDHLPCLRERLDTIACIEGNGAIPYLPGLRAPYYVFVGRKRSTPGGG